MGMLRAVLLHGSLLMLLMLLGAPPQAEAALGWEVVDDPSKCLMFHLKSKFLLSILRCPCSPSPSSYIKSNNSKNNTYSDF